MPKRSRYIRAISLMLLSLAALFAALWILSLIRGAWVHRITVVESGNVIKPTDPTEKFTEYNSIQWEFASHVGRFRFDYMCAEELNKAIALPRRVEWGAGLARGRGGGFDRWDAPDLIASLGFDWRFDHAEGGRANGEYWRNHDIFVYVPYWFLVAVTGIAGWMIDRRGRLVRRRMRRGQCLGCGYDIRASSGRCPECGLAFEIASA